MEYRIRYRSMICLVLSLLAAGCTREWPDDPEPPVEEEQATRIVFSSSDFTKADIHAPSDEDGITSIDLYGFVWGMLINRELGGIVTDSTLRIINFVHKQSSDNNTILIDRGFFVKDNLSNEAVYTNLYAIANQKDKMLYGTGLGQYSGFADYISAMEKKNQGFSKNLTQDDENCLKQVLVKVDDLEGKQDYPYLAKAVTVEGGASIVTIPLERLYCRVYFSFLLTGNAKDEITINTIMLSGMFNSGYLFLEQNSSDRSSLTTWSSEYSSDVFTDTFGTVVSQPLQPGRTMLTLCNNSDHSPIYFRSYQSILNDLTNAPEIWLTITSRSDEGQKTRILRAPLYSTSGMDGKFYYGFMRNHTYHVISTINASTLKLENVTVQMHDWIDRGEVDIPGFE